MESQKEGLIWPFFLSRKTLQLALARQEEAKPDHLELLQRVNNIEYLDEKCVFKPRVTTTELRDRPIGLQTIYDLTVEMNEVIEEYLPPGMRSFMNDPEQ